MLLKLYKTINGKTEYWITWDNQEGSQVVHWGELGSKGQTKEVKRPAAKKLLFVPSSSIPDEVVSEIEEKRKEGFAEISDDDLELLYIEYPVNGHGKIEELDFRHELEDRMNETLGWTGIGHCDGGSNGSGSMEVFCYVVDYEMARTIVVEDLQDTKFASYTMISNDPSCDDEDLSRRVLH